MRSGILTRPKRVLLTLDAVGGMWRYAVDLAACLEDWGIRTLLVGAGPSPDEARLQSVADSGTELIWTDLPLDWMCTHPTELDNVGAELMRIAKRWQADLLHLSLPSQAAGLQCELPVVVTSHSCVVTWWHAVRGQTLPPDWSWHHRLNREGLARAEVVVVPSRSHADAIERAYGALSSIRVIHHASAVPQSVTTKDHFVLSAGRWWDEGKNGRVLDEAAGLCSVAVRVAGPVVGPNGTRADFRHAEQVGDLSASAMAALMQRALIFAAPSLYEPFGLAVQEAAASGAALVLADIPTFRELWQDAALFVPARDPLAFAQAFDELAADVSRRRRLTEAAGSRARTFSRESRSEAIVQTYRVAMDRHAFLNAGVSGR